MVSCPTFRSRAAIALAHAPQRGRAKIARARCAAIIREKRAGRSEGFPADFRAQIARAAAKRLPVTQFAHVRPEAPLSGLPRRS